MTQNKNFRLIPWVNFKTKSLNWAKKAYFALKNFALNLLLKPYEESEGTLEKPIFTEKILT